MSNYAGLRGRTQVEFVRLHRMFVEHLAYACTLAWATALVAAWYAPWVRDIRALMGPGARIESTASYLFGLPILMTLALVAAARHPELLRRVTGTKNQAREFAFAGAVAFLAFCLAIQHAVKACSLGG